MVQGSRLEAIVDRCAEYYFRGDLRAPDAVCRAFVRVACHVADNQNCQGTCTVCDGGILDLCGHVVCIPYQGSQWRWLGLRSDHWRSDVGGFHIVRCMYIPMDLPTLIKLLEQQ
jgi:hypothetical protein